MESVTTAAVLIAAIAVTYVSADPKEQSSKRTRILVIAAVLLWVSFMMQVYNLVGDRQPVDNQSTHPSIIK